MPHQRRRVLYRGRVQGVGFRATARHLARGFAVSGYVKNLPDGQVELVAEGDSAELDAFLGAVRREFEDHLRGVDEAPEPPGGEAFDGFAIHY